MSGSLRVHLARRVPCFRYPGDLLVCLGPTYVDADTPVYTCARSERPEAKARKIIKTDNFTGQTNTVDVDKHMCVREAFPCVRPSRSSARLLMCAGHVLRRLAYIEAELAKKRGEDSASSDPSSNPSRPYDPRDELYRVAEKYKFADIAEQEGKKKERDEEEGNVTLSTGMLMGIPEVDLGIECVRVPFRPVCAVYCRSRTRGWLTLRRLFRLPSSIVFPSRQSPPSLHRLHLSPLASIRSVQYALSRRLFSSLSTRHPRPPSPDSSLARSTKLKNIEATEKAKRALREGSRPGSGPEEAAGLPPDKDEFAVDRCACSP